jgi:hypothetical protein
MACGHVANATNEAGAPCCAFCVGMHEGAEQVAQDQALAGRLARCTYYGGRGQKGQLCRSEMSSEEAREHQAFFGYRPHMDTDEFYCGCWGWE